MAFSAATVQSVLSHHLKIATWAARLGIYLGVHLPTTLNAAVLATATSITLDNDIPDGAKIVIDPLGTNPETFYSGPVTGTGPYTVPLLDAPGGVSAALVNNHAISIPVKFDPDNDLTLIIEPVSASYARLNFETWSYDGVTEVGTVTNNEASIKLAKIHTASNSVAITFAQATTAAWGMATHIPIYTALTGGTAIDVIEMDQPFDIVLNSILEFAIGTSKIKMASIN